MIKNCKARLGNEPYIFVKESLNLGKKMRSRERFLYRLDIDISGKFLIIYVETF